jgi:hypothetical protein
MKRKRRKNMAKRNGINGGGENIGGVMKISERMAKYRKAGENQVSAAYEIVGSNSARRAYRCSMKMAAMAIWRNIANL